jgi:hypothetical protein
MLVKEAIEQTEELIQKIESKPFKNEMDLSILKTLKQGTKILKDPNYNPNSPQRKRLRKEAEKKLKDQQNILIL